MNVMTLTRTTTKRREQYGPIVDPTVVNRYFTVCGAMLLLLFVSTHSWLCTSFIYYYFLLLSTEKYMGIQQAGEVGGIKTDPFDRWKTNRGEWREIHTQMRS